MSETTHTERYMSMRCNGCGGCVWRWHSVLSIWLVAWQLHFPWVPLNMWIT